MWQTTIAEQQTNATGLTPPCLASGAARSDPKKIVVILSLRRPAAVPPIMALPILALPIMALVTGRRHVNDDRRNLTDGRSRRARTVQGRDP